MKRISYLVFLTCIFCLCLAYPIMAQDTTCPSDAASLETGQGLLEEGDYEGAIAAFTCVLGSNPRELDAYRGRIEALLLSGSYSDAMLDYAAVKVEVVPTISDALEQIIAYYENALKSEPDNIRLLTGYSFAQWYNFNPEGAMVTLEQLLSIDPENLYGLVLHGNNSFFLKNQEIGEADFARAMVLKPESADIYFIMADGYLYGLGNLEDSLAAVTMASELGLDTPRTDAIFATCYFYLEEIDKAFPYYVSHIERSTTKTVENEALERQGSIKIYMEPGQNYHFPIEANADETLVITASSGVESESAMGIQNNVDTIMILIADDGTIITGNDDNVGLNAGFEFTISEAGTYTLILSSFEGAGLGEVELARQ